MTKKRIQVYTDAETKRRIELAAAKHDIAITQYCLAAIVQQLAEDDMLERERVEIPIRPTRGADEALIAGLRALHKEIKAYRGGELVDVDRELEQMRAERDHELSGLR
jgi:uncharacterized protein (DUF1778 family)